MSQAGPGEQLAGHAAWLELLLAHLAGPRLRAHVEIEDLVQEVFLRVLHSRRGPRAADAGAWRRYLAGVARHCVVDAVRALRAARRAGPVVRLSRTDWSHAGPTASQVALPAAGPLTRLGEAEEQRRRLQDFAALSPEHRRVIGLRQFQGLPAAECARRMGRSEAAIHSLYRRALLSWARAGDRPRGG